MAEEKINSAEIMSDEELDGVAGGTLAESQKDVKFLSAIGALTQGDEANLARITRAFASHGVGVVIHGDVNGYSDNPNMNNEYFINGKQVTRAAAFQQMANKMHAKIDQNTGDALDISKYL